jgi:exopolysaccharide production protein ExoY
MTIHATEIGSSQRSVFAILAWGLRPPNVRNPSNIDGVSTAESVLNESGSLIAEKIEAANNNESGSAFALTGLSDRQPIQPLGGKPKRLMDIAIASVTLLLAAPVMILVAVLIRLTAGGPAIFTHIRIGFKGKPFNCYKFRTMVANADQVLSEYLARNPEAAREWEKNRKLKHDPRITLLGRMLRKSSLDELPQLFNILRGHMSCVGPRPIVADELKRYGPFADDYLQTRPGLTGLWQVAGRNAVGYSRRVRLDSHYARNWSIWADLIILIWTAFAVMRFDHTS